MRPLADRSTERDLDCVGMDARIDSLLPLWQATAAPLPENAAIHGEHRALFDASPIDTIVIGAGVTGLSTALHLAEHGAQVIVLEKDQPGAGTSGRPNGQVIAGLHESPEALLAAYGADRGERMIQFSGKAPDLLFDLIARHGIACDAERAGWIQATRSRRQMKALAKLTRSWADRGAPVRLLDRDEVTRLLGTQAYAGGWLDQRNGTIQPLAYVRGLAAAATRAGAKIHCGIEVERLERAGQNWRIETTQGNLHASTVVLATNVFTSELHGVARRLLGRSYLAGSSVQVATAPLNDEQRAQFRKRYLQERRRLEEQIVHDEQEKRPRPVKRRATSCGAGSRSTGTASCVPRR